ncbi:DUF817 domain-containing protein [Lacunimicrobium album]
MSEAIVPSEHVPSRRQKLASVLCIFLWEFWIFGLKQAYACLFGGYLLFWIILTTFYYPPDPYITRYDFLLLMAVGFQAFLLLAHLETWRECCVIAVFHIVATAMEIFKTSDSIGSWHYPGEFRIGIGNVPLFAGFMYSAVGSYIARVWRVFDFRYSNYPSRWSTLLLVGLIYMNFFTHHYTVDLRIPLLIGSAVVFGWTTIYYRIDRVHRSMPLILGLFLVALFIWFAENIATYSKIWVYPNQQAGWKMVGTSKLIAWYLLMLLSFVLVSLVNRPRKLGEAINAK